MERIKLSNNLIITKVLSVIFLGIGIAVTISNFDATSFLIETLVFGVISYMIFYLPDRIEFDADNMYIIKINGVREVSLKDVESIDSTSLLINRSMVLIKIRYTWEGAEFTARFYPRYFSKSLTKFENTLQDKNPRARVDVFWPF